MAFICFYFSWFSEAFRSCFSGQFSRSSWRSSIAGRRGLRVRKGRPAPKTLPSSRPEVSALRFPAENRSRWPCEVDVTPLRGRDGGSQSKTSGETRVLMRRGRSTRLLRVRAVPLPRRGERPGYRMALLGGAREIAR